MDFYYATEDEWFLHIESKNLATLVGYMLTAGITVYVALFTIWATINAYHHRRLNLGWIIVFVILNVLGYWLYLLVDRNKNTE
jgi:membrane protein DedA with SNARE-associated domain